MSLSSVSAIGDMVAPVVLITIAVIFANGLVSAATEVGDRMFALNRECRGILGGPHGQMLDEDSMPPADRERLAQIRDEAPMIMRRAERLRNAVLITWISIGLFVLSVAAIAVAVTTHSKPFGLMALALVLAGVAGFFAAVASVLGPLARSANALMEETRRSGVLG